MKPDTPAPTPVVYVGLVALPLVAWCLTRHAPPWAMMWALAVAEFMALKLMTVSGLLGAAAAWRTAAYLLLWPGMNAREFLGVARVVPQAPTTPELAKALAKTALGLAGTAWAALHTPDAPALLVGWVGMLGLILSLHFGAFDMLSWGWRRLGVAATPIMRAPSRSTSLGEFWGERWNQGFADLARRFLFRPVARRWGTAAAGGAVFLVSGLVHESVISLPAAGGWGGPTIYFVSQALGIAAEKSAAGRRVGLGRGRIGWAWVLAVTALPLALLFHRPFVERVIFPMFLQVHATLHLP